MKLQTFIERHHLSSDQLQRFFRFEGRRFAERPAEEFDGYFDDFKGLLAAYADRALYGKDRLALFREVHDLVEALRETGAGLDESGRPRRISATYKLKDSFLSDAEIDLEILKALHAPMSQSQLAEEVLRCSRNAAGTRISALQDGKRLGDMQVKIAPPHRGSYGSTVHPVLLPLNLTELYVLLSVLGDAWRGRGETDPHAIIARDLANKIYFQLTDYARERLDPRLAERDALPGPGLPPTYDLETHSWGADGAEVTQVRLSRNWAYLEKTGTRVRVTLAPSGAAPSGVEEGTGELEVYGRMKSWIDQAPHMKDANKNPAHCFVLELDDHSLTALSWEDVIDIEAAPGPGTSR